MISTEFANAVNYFNPMINYFKIMGVKYTGFVNIYIFEMIIVAFIMVLGFKNAMKERDDFKPTINNIGQLVFLIVVSLIYIIYFGANSEFLYFNF